MERTGSETLGFIGRELDRIAVALRQPQPAKRYAELYAAQQALSWAVEPQGFKSPYVLIMGTQADSEGCPPCPCPQSS